MATVSAASTARCPSTVKQLRRGTHRSTRQLEAAIRTYLAVRNENPKPFVWVKTADEILAKAVRKPQDDSGAQH